MSVSITPRPSSNTNAPTSQQFTSGSGTYTTPTSPRTPLYLRVILVGGGGGSTGAGPGVTAGTDGGQTSFGSFTANGGLNSGPGGGGGSGTALVRLSGGSGSPAEQNNNFGLGGAGGGSPLGYPTFPGIAVTPGTPVSGISPSGGFGGGAAGPSGDLATFGGATGAGGGEYADIIITSPASTYPYVVGMGGAGGSGTASGASGADGLVLVQEFYE